MKTLFKEFLSTIKINFKRYLSIIIIIFLGVAFYVGMKANSSVLQVSMTSFFEKYNYGDIKLFSDIGLNQKELELIKKSVPSIDTIEGKYYTEAITNLKNDSNKLTEYAVYVHSYSNKYNINKLDVLEGRNINNSYECVVGIDLKERGIKLGDKIKLKSDLLKEETFKVVGFVSDPQYIAHDKGTSTTTGDLVYYFAYVDKTMFNISDDLFMVADIKLKNKYNNFTDDYNEFLDSSKKDIEKATGSVLDERGKAIIEEQKKKLEVAEADYNNKKAAVEAELNNAKKELESAERNLNKAKVAILPDKQIDEYFATLKADIEASKQSLDAMKTSSSIARGVVDILAAVEKGSQVVDENNNVIGYNDTFELQLTSALGEYVKSQYDKLASKVQTVYGPLKDANNALSEFSCSDINEKTDANLGSNTIDACNTAYNGLKQRVSKQNKTVQSYVDFTKELNSDIESIETISQGKDIFNKYATKVEKLYNDAQNEYDSAMQEYNKLYEEAKNNNAAARRKIYAKEKELQTAKNEYEKREKEALEGLEKYYNQIIEGKKMLQKTYKFTHYVYTRNDSYGYGNYYDDTIRIDKLAQILPLLFFIVASLVTATSITRLIQEERSKIGILKSLGFNKLQIILKYVLYSFSADLIGVVLGIIVGIVGFPIILTYAYSLRYHMPNIIYVFHSSSIILAILLSLLSTVLIAFVCALKIAKEIPSKLMRKKEVKNSPIVGIEKKIEGLNKLNLSKRIAFRNIFSNVIRSLMTIIGVTGCTTLIIASFNVRESLYTYISIQFNKIYDIDTEFYYKNNVSQYEINKDYDEISNLKSVYNAAIGRKEAVTIDENKAFKTYVVVPDTLQKFEKSIGIYNAFDKKEKIYLEREKGVVITEKLAKLLNLKKGDVIQFTDSSNVHHSATITDIAENYLFSYIYMNKDVYEKLYGYDLINNYLVVKYTDKANQKQEDEIIHSRGKYANFVSMSFYKDENKKVVNALDKLVYVIIISAGLLAFVVLYNISKISISEKNTEIATLKVIGYDVKWINKYVNYEIDVLKYIGILLGIVGGYYLTESVISACEMDFMMFYHGISILNYIYGILLTIVFSKVINFIIKNDIKNVEMSKALKVTEE